MRPTHIYASTAHRRERRWSSRRRRRGSPVLLRLVTGLAAATLATWAIVVERVVA